MQRNSNPFLELYSFQSSQTHLHDAMMRCMQRMQTWGDEFIKCQGELMSDVRSGES